MLRSWSTMAAQLPPTSATGRPMATSASTPLTSAAAEASV
jgi:hypothetical protein